MIRVVEGIRVVEMNRVVEWNRVVERNRVVEEWATDEENGGQIEEQARCHFSTFLDHPREFEWSNSEWSKNSDNSNVLECSTFLDHRNIISRASSGRNESSAFRPLEIRL